MYRLPLQYVLVSLALALISRPSGAACGLLAAHGKATQQLAQKVFLHWDPQKKIETLVIQPSFESNTPNFGIVVPTPTKPEIVAVPREFFMELSIFTSLNRRMFPFSRLKDPPPDHEGPRQGVKVKILAEGIVGTSGYRIVTAEKTDDLVSWMKENHYDPGDRDVLDPYVKKKWCFTLLRIDPAGMRKQGDGIYAGEVQPIGLRFASSQPMVPLRAARLGGKEPLNILFYIQAPVKMDLPGEGSYQYQWLPMLLNSRGVYPKDRFGEGYLPAKADDWLKTLGSRAPALVKQGEELGFGFANKQRPQPNKHGRTATTLEWSRRLTADDLRVLTDPAAYTERVPDPDEGFTVSDVKNDARREAVFKVIQRRLERSWRERPTGFLVRSAPPEDVARLKELTGRLHAGQFLTKLRKVFTRDETNDDLVFVPAQVGGVEDVSEYTEFLPASPP